MQNLIQSSVTYFRHDHLTHTDFLRSSTSTCQYGVASLRCFAFEDVVNDAIENLNCQFSKKKSESGSQLIVIVTSANHTPFFISKPFLTLAPKIVQAFLKYRPKNSFSNCLVNGLLTSVL